MHYPFNLRQESNGTWTILFPDIPEAATVADIESEVRLQATNALEAAFKRYFLDGRAVPSPSLVQRGQGAIALTALHAVRIHKHNESLKAKFAVEATPLPTQRVTAR